MLELKGRTIHKQVEPQVGQTILDTAMKHGVDWAFSCARGTCARCRCLVEEGGELLSEPSDAEWNRLDEEELAQGFRLGCQATVMKAGAIKAVHAPY